MLFRRLAPAPFVAALVLTTFTGAHAAPKELLELFTSQGCSSCPPADRLLGEFANDPSVVALSLPIDIWDYLGWKDTLALPGHTARQRAYAQLRGDREVYTPQIVVNGSMHVLGSDHAAIEHVIVQTDRNAAVMSLPVLLSSAGGDLTVTIKASTVSHATGEAWLCPVAHEISVAIGRGENRGRTVTYHNVVRGWRRLGEWTGTDSTWRIPLSEIAVGHADAAAVIVQEGTREKPGIILGAAITRLGGRTTDGGPQITNK
jgi:hypothetical protein